jgi:polar amino acid transport system substrate-binding protein
MNNKKKILLLTFLLCPNAHSTELVACIDDHPPYQVIAEKPYGTHINALEVLADVLNKQLKFIKSPNFARCVVFLKQGQVDVIAGLNPSTERDKFSFYTPFKPADDLRVLSKEGITITKYDDLKGKIIGISRGTSYFPRFDNDNELKKITMQSDRIGFSLLLKNRVDLILVSPVMLKTLSEELNTENLKISPIKLSEMRNKETNFGFSKLHKLGLSSQEIIDKVHKAYKQGRFD